MNSEDHLRGNIIGGCGDDPFGWLWTKVLRESRMQGRDYNGVVLPDAWSELFIALAEVLDE